DRVDVPVRVITFQSLLEPYQLTDAKTAFERRRDAAPIHGWVPCRRQQTLRGGNRQAEPVHLDRSAFHDDAGLVRLAAAENARHVRRNLVVEIGRILSAPPVELPVDE